MSSTTSTVQTKGIYHHLPTFPAHDGKKYSAIVTGANGISGSAIVDVLAENPERWETIYAVSRRPPVSTQAHVKGIAADFLSPPEDIAEILKKEGVKALVTPLPRLPFICLYAPSDYIFFASYVQPPTKAGEALWSNTDEMDKMNGITKRLIFDRYH